MTGVDAFLVGMAAVDLIAVAVMVLFALGIVQTAQSARRCAQPALEEARALVDTGRAMAAHAQTDGQAVVTRVKGVSDKVRQRVATTRRIAGELKPHGRSDVGEVRIAGAELVRRARSAGGLARSIARLRAAADAARAARNP